MAALPGCSLTLGGVEDEVVGFGRLSFGEWLRAGGPSCFPAAGRNSVRRLAVPCAAVGGVFMIVGMAEGAGVVAGRARACPALAALDCVA